MPVSANEETGVKPITRQSIDYPAGIPIKKRRFPLIMPPSPPAEEPSLGLAESNSLQKDQSSPSQGSTLSYSSVATSSSGLSDAVKHPEPEERRGTSSVANDYVVQGNNNFAKVKVEEPSPSVQPGSVGNMIKNQVTLRQTELKLATAGSLALNVGIDSPIKQRTEVKVEPEMSALRENSKSLLSFKEHLVPALSSQNSGRSGRSEETLEPISLNLSLSKERSSSQYKSTVDELNGDSAHPCANRANWDLNIPMDTWEGSSSDAAVGQTSANGMGTAGRTQDAQPLIGLAITAENPASIESKNITNFSITSRLSGHQYKSDDSLHLQLSPSCLNFPVQGPSTTNPRLDSNKIIPSTNLPRVVVPSSNMNMVNMRPVKSEPVEERIKLDTRGGKPSSVGLLDSATVKRESVDQGCLETVNSSYITTPKSLDPKSIKSEPALEGNKETMILVKGKAVNLNEQIVLGPDKHSLAAVTCKTAEIACPVGNSSFLTENLHSSATVACRSADIACPAGIPPLSAEYISSSAPVTSKTAEIICPAVNSSVSTGLVMSVDVLKQSGNFSSTSGGHSKMHHEACESSRQVIPDLGATSMSIDGKVDAVKAEDSNIDNPKQCESKVTNDLPLQDGEGTVSDEEKINISADVEDSYSSDCESDGNHAIDMAIDMELDSDYEDGEVREPLERTAVEEPVCEKGQLEHTDKSDFDRKVMGTVGLVNNADHTESHVEEKGVKTDTAEIDKKIAEEASGALHSNKCEKGFDKTTCLQELSTVENSPSGAPLNDTNKTEVRILLEQSGKRDVQECQETDSEQAANGGGEETVLAIVQETGLNVDKVNLVQQNDTAFVKSSSNDDNAAKDIDSGSHRSRIINLPRSSGSSSPGRNRTFSERLLPSRGGRERFSDVANEGDRVYFRGREEIYIDDTQKFSRERHHDQTPRNSRFNFMRGRGRIANRLDNFRGDRESDRDFASEFHNSQTEFRVARHKYGSAASDADHEYNSYNITQDSGFVGSGRGGRKPLNDGGLFVRRMPSRRRSPGAGRGIHMVRRIPRNISPSRCVGEDGSELVRIRRNEKFARGFPDDALDPMFPRPQPPFEGVDGHFTQGNRNFPSVQRRVMHQIRSKSPLNSRNRSPGPWSSPRRRSPDGFGGHPDLTHQRSPFYRIDRMRSPDRRCFPGEVVVRRHDMREMDSGRDHGHPGSGMPNRSPSSRIALRERRFGGLDPQERPESDDFFGGPMHSGRLHDLGSDVNGEERRFVERRGPVRPYRAPFNGAEGENFHLSPEDASRPLRFGPDDDAEFQEREFHRRNKNRLGNAPRRMRNIEEQEANYRHGGQVWHNNDFDEISRVKKKRF